MTVFGGVGRIPYYKVNTIYIGAGSERGRVSVDDQVPNFVPEAWGFDNPSNRERYIRPKAEPTEMLSFRAVGKHARILDEIIHSGIDPRLKTKSDCLQDAVVLFIEHWTDNFADGLSGRTLRMLQMERVAMQGRARQEFLDQHDETYDEARRAQDTKTLRMLYMNLQAERQEAVGFSPDTYIADLDKRIERMADLF